MVDGDADADDGHADADADGWSNGWTPHGWTRWTPHGWTTPASTKHKSHSKKKGKIEFQEKNINRICSFGYKISDIAQPVPNVI